MPRFFFNIRNIGGNWQEKVKTFAQKFNFGLDMFMKDKKAVADLRDKVFEILTAGGVTDTRDKIAVGMCLHRYFLGLGPKEVCQTCGREVNTKVGYAFDPTGWESLVNPDELLSYRHRMADCNNHTHTLNCIWSAIGMPFVYIFISGRQRIVKGHLRPIWTHVTTGIDVQGKIIPIETISPRPFGQLAAHNSICVFRPANNTYLYQLNRTWTRRLGWKEKMIPFPLKFMKIRRR